MEHQSEVELIYQLITHQAGFTVELFSTLYIRSEEDGSWIVKWENFFCPHSDPKSEWEELTFANAMQACQCFIELRYRICLGLDLEEQHFENNPNGYIEPMYSYLSNEEIAELKTRYNAK